MPRKTYRYENCFFRVFFSSETRWNQILFFAIDFSGDKLGAINMSAKRITVIGGTSAQGILVVRDLIKSGFYKVRALTHDPDNHALRYYSLTGYKEP